MKSCIVVATKNRGKVAEIKEIMAKWGIDVITRDMAGVPPELDIVEDGKTFEENSLKKAKVIMEACGMPAMADDSGLMVDYLGGAPGVFSARFSGEEGNDMKNMEKVLKLMENVPRGERNAHFETVITLLYPDGRKLVAKGICRGEIAMAPVGEGGFGYDPIFIPEGYNQTFAQLGAAVKNEISHRGKALKELERLIDEKKR